ncbi:hypothetical protein B484DRAFT_12431, partial [Ochromonadaceae sp. CCMP2298]
MGCTVAISRRAEPASPDAGTSVSFTNGKSGKSKALSPTPSPLSSRRINLESTGGLQMILQQPVLRRKLRSFINDEWTPQGGQHQESARTIACNCLDFWTDAKDFSKLRASPFRSYRAAYLFEKYLMHGAARQVPVSTNVLDDCVSTLFSHSPLSLPQRDTDTDSDEHASKKTPPDNVPADIFDASEGEVTTQYYSVSALQHDLLLISPPPLIPPL